ncbi:hypothetical protein M422DRAFT_261069 [Sphaerobolus stellatus SS14]|uniref:JmjC domain-containing protein n=1 Tax=Sphaerobolus stellatus (strain SS14) TaxID=990650 RepID=A0A0C9UNX9_SPHS4|nr:hypothetical protein M422DRAFT_261069 [Sphaerobolus stellatus SS14]
MAKVNFSDTYSQTVSFQLDQLWFLQLIQSLTNPVLLTANSSIQWESKKPWPFLHKVYPELASISTDGPSSNSISEESINDIDEDLPGLPEQATAKDLSRKVKWLKLQRVIQCDGGPLNTEHLVFKVLFPWECKQDMEIMNLLFPKATVPKETVPNPVSEQSTSPESPLTKLSNSTDKSDSEDNEDGPKIEFNFYRAKCHPAALRNMGKLGRDGLPIGNIFPCSIKDRLSKSDRPIQWVPDVKFSDLKTALDYKDFELDVQDLHGTLMINVNVKHTILDYCSRDPGDTYSKSHMCIGSIRQGLKLKRKVMNYLDLNYASDGNDPAIRVLADDTLAMQCPTGRGFDPYETNWMICTAAAAFHCAKLWICVVPKNGYHLEGSIEDADPDHYDLICFILEEDHYLTMDPGLVHFVLSLTDSVTQGGHFYNSEAFEKTMWARQNEHFYGHINTNMVHPSNEWILHTLAIAYHQELLAMFPKWLDKKHHELLFICSVLELREESPSMARSILDFNPEIKKAFLEIVKELDNADQPL